MTYQATTYSNIFATETREQRREREVEALMRQRAEEDRRAGKLVEWCEVCQAEHSIEPRPCQ
jgi:hypothetical protein